jgi:apolipoprotein N-acyltransferase
MMVLAVSGLLQAISLAWPLPDWSVLGLYYGQPQPYAQWFGVVLLVKVLTWSNSARQALMWALWAQTVAGAGTFWWLYVSMAHYGALPPWLAILAVIVLAAALALYFGLSCGVLFWLLSRGHRTALPMLFAATWLLAEWARATFFTGFPWGNAATAHLMGLGVFAPWLGALGVGALAAGLAAWVGVTPWAWSHKGRVFASLSLCAVLISPATPWATADWSGTSAGNTSSVALLQGNIEQSQKFDPEHGIPRALNWYQSELLQPSADVVVAPETAIPLLQTQLEPEYWQTLWSGLAQGRHAALLGVPIENRWGGYENAAWLVTPGQAKALSGATAQATPPSWPQGYSKIHLVPFGEYTPPGFLWFAGMLGMPLSGFTAGQLNQPSQVWAGQRWGIQICYEDVFGGELAQRMRYDAPTVWVNLSNIAWFGDTIAISQHLNIARWRARELGRPVIRSTNTGATAVIDHLGQVQASLTPYTRGVLKSEVTGREGLTPYVMWAGWWGDTPLLLWALAVLGWAAWRARSLSLGRLRPSH